MYLAVDNTAVATATAERRRRADTPLGRLEQLLSTLTATALLSDWPTTRASATRAEAVPLLAGGTDKRIRVALGMIKKAKPTPMRNRRCGEGLESATCEYAKSDAARRPAPRRHCRGGCLVAQPTRQRLRDSHGEGLKRKQHPGVLRRHIVLLLKQKTKRRRQSRRGEIVKKRRDQQRREHEAPEQHNVNHRTPLPTLVKILKRPPLFPIPFCLLEAGIATSQPILNRNAELSRYMDLQNR